MLSCEQTAVNPAGFRAPGAEAGFQARLAHSPLGPHALEGGGRVNDGVAAVNERDPGRASEREADRAFARAPNGAGKEGDDLLAMGVRRYLPGTTLTFPQDAYARIEHPSFTAGRSRAGALAALLGDDAHDAGNDSANDAAIESQGVRGDGPLLFLDIESLGFVGRPVFLIGALTIAPCPAERDGENARGRLVQYLARDYSEEEAMLAAFFEEGRACPAWVSFNGRTFDVPSLLLRGTLHRLQASSPARHLDLLPVARRLWGARLPDCRLQTLEHHICGRPRGDDIAGADIPAAYHDFVRHGDPWEVLRILHHNAADLVSLWRIYREACAQADA